MNKSYKSEKAITYLDKLKLYSYPTKSKQKCSTMYKFTKFVFTNFPDI